MATTNDKTACRGRIQEARTKQSGKVEVVVDGETGVLVHPRDPLAIAQAVTALFSEPERLRKMGANARARAVAGFSSRPMAERTMRLYRFATGQAVITPEKS